jgi:hypothetical protein
MQILSLQLNADAVPFGTAPVVLHAPGMEARYLRLTFLTMAKMAGRWTFVLSEMIFDLMGDLAASEEGPAKTHLLPTISNLICLSSTTWASKPCLHAVATCAPKSCVRKQQIRRTRVRKLARRGHHACHALTTSLPW